MILSTSFISRHLILIVLIILIILVIVPYKCREILGYRILQSMSPSGKFFSRTTPSIIARELPAGKINHIYLSQNSFILCFIILNI